MRKRISFMGARRMRVEAVIDGVSGQQIRGWAWLPDRPEQVLEVECHTTQGLHGRGKAELYRADLQQAGKRNGHCGFQLEAVGLAGCRVQLVAVSPSLGLRQPLGEVSVPALEPLPAADLPPADAGQDIFPIALLGPAGSCGFIDSFGPRRLRGWVQYPQPPEALVLQGEGLPPHRFVLNVWRGDVAAQDGSDGYCGFDIELPEAWLDGKRRDWDVRVEPAGPSLLARPVRVRLDPPARSQAEQQAHPAAWPDPTPTATLSLSIIVVFYNMSREAVRTLTSLQPSYQQGIEGLDYEVLCVDNGSTPPLDPAWLASLGPIFRHVRPTRPHPSPCQAINAAARMARGRYLAIMIDGAHVLSPGVLREAWASWQEQPDAVVALRHWFVGGDQRWLSRIGYRREDEDRLFQRIAWPRNGYELFRISAPIGEQADPWFSDMTESNCLLLPSALYARLGGIDERFDEAGGGYANLDLFRRAAELAASPVVVLIGEASFHQYHAGTTTNVDDAEKDRRVRRYSSAYHRRRGLAFDAVPWRALRFRGQLHSPFAIGQRERPLMPVALPLSDQIRPASLVQQLGHGSLDYLRAVYAESGWIEASRWQGHGTGIAAGDLINLQELIHALRPDTVVLAGTAPGLVHFVHDVSQLAAAPPCQLLVVGEAPSLPAHARVRHFSATDGDPMTALGHALGLAETVLVLLALGDDPDGFLARLEAYAAMVSHRSYLIVVDTLFGQPWLGYSRRPTRQSLRQFLRCHPEFKAEHSWDRHLASTCVEGYLHRVGGGLSAADADPELDLCADGLGDTCL